MYTQQWIDEYLEPEEIEERPRKPIPIRSKSEFLPAVFEFETLESESLAPEDQFSECAAEVRLDVPARAAQHEVDDVVRLIEIDSADQPVSDNCAETLCHPVLKPDTHWPAAEFEESVIQGRIANEARSKDKKHTIESKVKDVSPIRVPRRSAQPNAIAARPPSKLATKKVKHPGFWIGCAMGSAAAAVLLMAIRFAVGTM
jgi:hypothetical protein